MCVAVYSDAHNFSPRPYSIPHAIAHLSLHIYRRGEYFAHRVSLAIASHPLFAPHAHLKRLVPPRAQFKVRHMSFLSQMWSRAGAAYRLEVGKRLASRGLLYEDLLVETADVKLALSRLPKDVLAAREQRLKRAMVLSSQQRYLPDEVSSQIDPFQKYLAPYIEAVEEAKKEEVLLGK